VVISVDISESDWERYKSDPGNTNITFIDHLNKIFQNGNGKQGEDCMVREGRNLVVNIYHYQYAKEKHS